MFVRFKLNKTQLAVATARSEAVKKQAYQDVKNGETSYDKGFMVKIKDGVQYYFIANLPGWVGPYPMVQGELADISLNGVFLDINCNRALLKTQVLEVIKNILGSQWRFLQPTEYKTEYPKLYWWETLDHYYHYRAEWEEYFKWMQSHMTEGDTLVIPERFTDARLCLTLLKEGKLDFAYKRFKHELVHDLLQVA